MFCIFHGIGGRTHAIKRVPQWSRPLVPVLPWSIKACKAARLDKTALAAATPSQRRRKMWRSYSDPDTTLSTGTTARLESDTL